MIETAIEFSRYFVALLFGTAVAAGFAGMPAARKNYLVLFCFTIVIFMVQVACLFRYGMEFTWKIYPLICHLPIAAFIAVYLKRTWLISVISMFTSFLCCQPPRWMGSVAGEVFDSVTANHLGYIISVFLMYYIIQKYVAKSVRHLMERSTKSCLIFGAVPVFYYFVDYTATVYTDFLYRGTRVAVQFMPFVIAAFYFVFVLYYYSEMQKQARIERERDMLEMQLRQAQTEFASMRQMQQNAAAYRHDMRHHFALLQGMAAEGRIEEIKEYLRTAQSDMDAITPSRFCENDTVNLILSYYTAKAKQSAIQLAADVKLPASLSFSDTELCSLLSNALENAIHTCKNINNSNQRHIKLRMFYKNNKLCMDIRNSYQTEPVFRQGLPISNEQGHGFGTKSMVQIVEKHGGIWQFSVKDGWFIYQATV